MDVKTWKTATRLILWSLISTFVLAIVTAVVFLMSFLPAVNSVAYAYDGEFNIDLPWYIYVFPVLILVTYILYFIGIHMMARNLPYDDGRSFGRIRTALILNFAGIGTSFIPEFGIFITFALEIMGFAWMMMAFRELKGSETFPAKARKGALLLYISMFLALGGAVLNFIPIIAALGSLMSIAGIVLQIVGWTKIAAAEPLPEEEIEVVSEEN